MALAYEDALALLIRENEELSFTPKITDITFDEGGDIQIGDMTWDHDNASITVSYTRGSDDLPGNRFTYHVDLEYYNADSYGESKGGRTGFAGFMDDLLRVAAENPTK